MTRKDYVLIAAALRTTREELVDPMASKEVEAAGQDAVDLVAANIADALQGDNPRFDRRRFITAAALKED